MLDFKKPCIEDKEWVNRCFGFEKSMNCEYTFGNVFLWATAYSTMICEYNGFFICRWGRRGDFTYSMPIGRGDLKDAILQIIEDAKQNGVKLRIYGITDDTKERLEDMFGCVFSYEYDDGFNDYIYSVEKMAELRGKKYHGKRNHISNFKKNNPDWSFERIDESNIADCIELHTSWINNHDSSSYDDVGDYSLEFDAVLKAFENYSKLDFVGGLIRVNGKAIAYCMGEKQSDKLFVTHFEKAPSDVQGAYTIINQEFTRNCLMDYEYVNREEDLGLEGLRKAKQSYHPEILLKKYNAIYEGD